MAAPLNPVDIQPRQVANKSDKKALLDAIRMTLGVQSAAIRRNTQTFNRNRYTAIARIADYDAMKDRARQTKEHSIANLPELLAPTRGQRSRQRRPFLPGQDRRRRQSVHSRRTGKARSQTRGEREEHHFGRDSTQPHAGKRRHRSRGKRLG